MKPLSEEELSKSAWEDFLNCQEVDDDAINAYIYGYKRGYAKCIKQMQDGFNELLVACNTSMNRLRWISVEDRLPEPNFEDTSSKWVLACVNHSGVFIDSYNHKHGEWCINLKSVTHWMPLPEPPKKGGEL